MTTRTYQMWWKGLKDALKDTTFQRERPVPVRSTIQISFSLTLFLYLCVYLSYCSLSCPLCLSLSLSFSHYDSAVINIMVSTGKHGAKGREITLFEALGSHQRSGKWKCIADCDELHNFTISSNHWLNENISSSVCRSDSNKQCYIVKVDLILPNDNNVLILANTLQIQSACWLRTHVSGPEFLTIDISI